MAKFFSAYNPPRRFVAPSGTRYVGEYQERLDDLGHAYPFRTGERDMYAYIQASKNETDIYAMLDRYDATQDASILNVVQGSFGDFVSIPKSLAEAQQQFIDAQKRFNGLPIKLRKAVDNDVNVFLTKLADGSLADVLQEIYPVPAKPDLPKVKEEKSE